MPLSHSFSAGVARIGPQTKIDVPLALRAYQLIVDHGARNGDVYSFEGLRAGSDFDGYTVFITDEATTVRLMFHSKFALDTPGTGALDRFNRRLRRLVEDDGRGARTAAGVRAL